MTSISYYFNGRKHRFVGAAHITYYERGNIHYKEYYINGECTRLAEFYPNHNLGPVV